MYVRTDHKKLERDGEDLKEIIGSIRAGLESIKVLSGKNPSDMGTDILQLEAVLDNMEELSDSMIYATSKYAKMQTLMGEMVNQI